METTPLGNTGLEVTRLGMGLSEIGSYELDQDSADTVAAVLNAALDGGINFLDTAACYGNSEELVGRAVSSRRNEFVLASKCAHKEGGYEGHVWDRPTVESSIDRSLKRLQTDHIDVMQLHTCELEVLKRGEVIEALLDAKQAGKVRFAGYSGDNEEALWAVESGHFDTLQTSFSLVDQRARTWEILQKADQQGMGVIIKRPIGNAVWRAAQSTSAYADEYFRRAQEMAGMGDIADEPEDRIETSLGFTFAHPQVDTAILGTQNQAHMQSNVRMVESGMNVPGSVIAELQARFDKVGENWEQRG